MCRCSLFAALIIAFSADKTQGLARDEYQFMAEGILAVNDLLDIKRRRPSKTHKLPLKEGGVFVLELSSTAFDTFMPFEDPTGNAIAEDDERQSGAGQGSRDVCGLHGGT